MSEENVAVVRAQFEAVNREDWDAAMALYADDVELVVPETTFLSSGTFVGKEAVGEWFGDWMRTFRERHFELLELHDVGDRVAVAARHTAKGRGSGVEIQDDLFYSYEVRDGRVARIEFCDSRNEALRAAGISREAGGG